MSNFLHVNTGRINLFKNCGLKLSCVILRPLGPWLSVVIGRD